MDMRHIEDSTCGIKISVGIIVSGERVDIGPSCRNLPDLQCLEVDHEDTHTPRKKNCTSLLIKPPQL
jgi:hypothetical protein